MTIVYQIKENGFFGESKEIDPQEGVPRGWTYTPPPYEGSFKWIDCKWVEAIEPPAPSLEAPASWPPAEPEMTPELLAQMALAQEQILRSRQEQEAIDNAVTLEQAESDGDLPAE